MSVWIPAHHVSSLEYTARRICESRGGKWSGTKGMARCPAHKDRTPSLGVTLGRKAILFHCFAGCDQQSVLSALAREGFEVARFFSGSSAEDQLEPTKGRKGP
ncbi:MAG: virulence protein, partial [Alphaproteobacteria bacterium]|nr:virulence protein [Alphaproteobacteria bacterium]